MNLTAQPKVTSKSALTSSPPASPTDLVVPVANPQQGEFIDKSKLSNHRAPMNPRDGGASASDVSLSASLAEESTQPRESAVNVASDNINEKGMDSAPASNATHRDRETASKSQVKAGGDAAQRVMMGMANMSLENHVEIPSCGFKSEAMAGSNNNKLINHVKIPATQHDRRKLFVGGLPADLSEANFLRFFEQFGEVIDSVVMIDRTTKRSRGFGFITFAREEVALSLLTSIPRKTGTVMINGKTCEVKASEPKAEGGSSHHHHRGGGWNASGAGVTSQRVPTMVGGTSTKAKHSHDYDNRDNRNFDDIYQPHPNAAYSSADYGRNHHAMYHPIVYPHATNYHSSAATGNTVRTHGGGHHASYPYSANSSAWETSYPGPNSGEYANYSYGTAISANAGGLGDNHQYAAYYTHQGHYANSSMYHQYNTVSGGVHPSYAQYSNYYATSGAGTGMPPHGTYNSDGSLESYPQNVAVGGAYPVDTGDVGEEAYDDSNYGSNAGY